MRAPWRRSKRRRRDPLGPRGERAAERYLRRRGYRTLGRNLTTSVGEADLLMLAPDGRTIVLAEVKSRRVGPRRPDSRRPPPPPEATVTAAKRRKLVLVLGVLARANNWQGRPTRIDVLAVSFHPGRLGRPRAEIRHIERAVTADGRAG